MSSAASMPVSTITPVTPGGAVFTFIYSSDPTDGFASTVAPAARRRLQRRTLAPAISPRSNSSPRTEGSLLQSNVGIVIRRVDAADQPDCSNRPPLHCGAAGTLSSRISPTCRMPDTLYPAALANATTGFDLQPARSGHHGPHQRRRRPRLQRHLGGLVVQHHRDHADPRRSHRDGRADATRVRPWPPVSPPTTTPAPAKPPATNLGRSALPTSTTSPSGKLWKDMTDAERSARSAERPQPGYGPVRTHQPPGRRNSCPVVDLVVNTPSRLSRRTQRTCQCRRCRVRPSPAT